MPDEGTTVWDDAIKGRIEYPNEKLEDLVLLRSDGRPTYNLAAAVDDADSAITHVIRGEDHVPNTPKQIRILEALGRPLPVYAHVPNVMGTDGKKLSKRHGAVSVEEFRARGYVAPALMNYLALLGWSYDDKTTIMSRDELVERFGLERVGSSPATFDYDKLDWMNGVYLRELPPEQYASELVAYLRETGFDGDEETIRASAPLVQEKIAPARGVSGLRRLPLRAPRGAAGADRRLGPGARRGARDARNRRPVHRRTDRGRAPRACRAPRQEAARGVRPHPCRRHRVADLAGALREPRAPRARRVAGARSTPRWPSPPSALRAGRGRSRRRRAPGRPPRRATLRAPRPR